ncbi:hypothetical protein N7540_000144 [Penicillium herquei]|nr:hypothetical protein N7540_000144 [Penicillium herquei]
MFLGLNMEKKKKISLSCLMGLGIFAMIASIVKTVELRAITSQADLTYAMANLAIWWTLEAYFVLIATSIPTLKPIVSRSGQHSKNSSSKKPSPGCRLSSQGYKIRPDSLEEPDQLLSHCVGSGGSQESSYTVGVESYPLEDGYWNLRQGKLGEDGIERTTTIGVNYR